MSNAVKFTDAGEIGVSLSEEDGRVVCSVRDSGVGIRDQDREAVFDRFRQVGEKAAGKPKGTGLGLAICKRIVVLHGGSIRVEGGVDRGSTFVFDFPKGV
jgi:signal transduction histidine kinase